MSSALRLLQDFSEFKAEHSLSHELPYWDFLRSEGNCVVLSDGSLVQALRLKGASIETWDEDAINRFTQSLRGVLNSLPDEAELQFFVDTNSDYQSVIEKHQSLKGSNPLISWLSDERAARLRAELTQGGLTKPNLYLFIYLRMTRASMGIRSFFEKPKQFHQVRASEHELRVKELVQLTTSVRDGLSAAGISSVEMESDAVAQLIYRFLNPLRSLENPAPSLSPSHRDQEFTPQEVKAQPALSIPSPREQLVFSDLIQRMDNLYLDGFYHRVLTLKTLPEFTHAALISKLLSLPFHFTLSIQIRVPEQSKELSSLQTKRRMAHSMSAGQAGRVSDLESEAKLQSTEELLRELIQTGNKIFYFQLALVIRDKSKDVLEQKSKAVLSRFRELNGAEAVAETVAGFKVFKTCLPAGNSTMVRAKRTKTDNLADFLPLYQAWEGSGRPVCLFRNPRGGIVSYDPFDPLLLPNFNALVTGSAGAGKSFINNCILLQYLTQNPRLYIIDIGGSYRKLCELMKGEYIDVAPPTDGGASHAFQAINPFQLPPNTTEPSPRKIKFLLALMETLLTDEEGDKLGKLDKSLLEEAITKTYQRCFPKRMPRLSDFVEVLNDWKTANDAEMATKLKHFAKMLYPWTGSRPYGRLLDTESSFCVESDFMVFDLKSLSSFPDLQSVMLLIITDLILGKIDSQLGRPGRILMDEAWELLKSQGAMHFMEYCVRTLRKALWGITFITQGLDEIVQSPIGPAILNNTATKFILLQRGDLEPTRKCLKLNSHEMALISGLKQVKGTYSEAFLIANEERGVIRMTPTPLEYWISTSDAADNALLASFRKENPNLAFPDVIHQLATRYPQGSQGVVRSEPAKKAA
jgi:type IV secretory pathway VirB4 component